VGGGGGGGDEGCDGDQDSTYGYRPNCKNLNTLPDCLPLTCMRLYNATKIGTGVGEALLDLKMNTNV
jgi:hypothetical protein